MGFQSDEIVGIVEWQLMAMLSALVYLAIIFKIESMFIQYLTYVGR